jgi:amidase
MTDSTSALPDATELASRVRNGEVSALELVDEAIGRAEALNPTLNAIVEPDFERARDVAKRFSVSAQPLAGVPTLLKDLATPREGDPAYHGNPVLRQLDHRYGVTGAVARRLDQAGVISIGRSHSPEFGCGNCTASAETVLYGPTRNPWSTAHTPMGSSGGAAAAVASGMVPIAQATDGGGSIRMPASACGLVGLKPSRGRVSDAPAGEVWAGGCSNGVVSRTVRDTAAALDILSGYEVGDPVAQGRPPRSLIDALDASNSSPLSIGLCTGLPYTNTAPDCAAAVNQCGLLLEGLGNQVSVGHPLPLESLDYLYDYITVIRVSLATDLTALAATIQRPWQEADMENGTWVNFQRGLKVSAVDYALARARLFGWSRDLISWWQDFDVLLLPTLATPPPTVGHLVTGPERERTDRLAATIPFTPQFNVSGQPAISLPLFMSTDEHALPIGVQLVGAPGREDLLIGLAAALEEAAPWHQRQPHMMAT